MERVSVTITTDTPIKIKVTRSAELEGVSRLLSDVNAQEDSKPTVESLPPFAAEAGT